MRVPFRQGLVSFQKVGATPTFLQLSQAQGFVAQIVDPTPIVATFAHGSSDYLMIFDTGVSQAWGPIVGGNNYLFWDIDRFSGQVSRGITLLEPIVSSVQPVNPVNGQHWFDLNQNKMKVWKASTSAWAEVIRLFAGVVNGAVVTPRNAGSQVNLNIPANAGFIQLDTLLQPLRKSNGEFLTDKDASYVRNTSNTSGVLIQPSSRITTVKAGETIPAMSLVYFSEADTVRLASSNPALMPARIPVGLVTQTLNVGDQGNLLTGGEVSYDQWDWSSSPGAPLYCTSSGQITLTRPAGLMAYRVGFVKNANTIIFNIDAETQPQVYTAEVGQVLISGTSPVQVTDVVNQLGERVVTITVPQATPFAPGLMPSETFATIASIDTRVLQNAADILALQSSKANLSHTHVVGDVIGLQSALDARAPLSHTHTAAQITNLQPLLDAKANLNHNHIVTQVSGLQDALNQKAFVNHLNAFDEIYQSVQRTEGDSDIGIGITLEEVLTTKSNTGHTHTISQVTGLQAALNDKAPVVHTHVIADVTNLQSELNLRALTNHTHVIADVSGLQATLNDKAQLNHTHVAANITDFSEAVDDRVSAFLQPGDNITLAYDDVANVLTISSSGGGASLTPGNLVDPILFDGGELSVQHIAIDEIEVQENVKVGVSTAPTLSGARNVVVGSRAAAVANSGDENVIVGHSAGDELGNGSNNVLIGASAGCQVVNGNNNIMIGRSAGRQQALDLLGDLSNAFIVNNETLRDPATTVPYIRGDMDPGYSTLTVQADLFLTSPDGIETLEISQTTNTIAASDLRLISNDVEAGNTGNVRIRTGDSGFSPADTAGDIILETGLARGSFYDLQGGSVVVRTGDTERLAVSAKGELKFDQKTGERGQVLTSRGAGFTPEWTNPSEVVQAQTVSYYTFDKFNFSDDWSVAPQNSEWTIPGSIANLQTGRLFSFDPATGIIRLRKRGSYQVSIEALIIPTVNAGLPSEDSRFPVEKMVYATRVFPRSPFFTVLRELPRTEGWVPGYVPTDESQENLEAVSLSYSVVVTTGFSSPQIDGTFGKEFSVEFRANSADAPPTSGYYVRTSITVTRLGPEIDGTLIVQEDFDVDQTALSNLRSIDTYSKGFRWASFRGDISDLEAADGYLNGLAFSSTLADAVLNYEVTEPANRVDVQIYVDPALDFVQSTAGVVVYSGIQSPASNPFGDVSGDEGQNVAALTIVGNSIDPSTTPGWSVEGSVGLEFLGATIGNPQTGGMLKSGLHTISIERTASDIFNFYVDGQFLTSAQYANGGAGWESIGRIGVGLIQDLGFPGLIKIVDVKIIRLPFIGV